MSASTAAPTPPMLPPAGSVLAALASREQAAAQECRRSLAAIEPLSTQAQSRGDGAELTRLRAFGLTAALLAQANEVRAAFWTAASTAAGGVGIEPLPEAAAGITGGPSPSRPASPVSTPRLPPELTPVIVAGTDPSATPSPAGTRKLPANRQSALDNVEAAEFTCGRALAAAGANLASPELRGRVVAAVDALGTGLSALRTATDEDPAPWAGIP